MREEGLALRTLQQGGALADALDTHVVAEEAFATLTLTRLGGRVHMDVEVADPASRIPMDAFLRHRLGATSLRWESRTVHVVLGWPDADTSDKAVARLRTVVVAPLKTLLVRGRVCGALRQTITPIQRPPDDGDDAPDFVTEIELTCARTLRRELVRRALHGEAPGA